MPKGDPLSIAEVAGINGVKKTSELIPLCHPLPLDHISLHTEIDEKKYSIIVYCLVSANSKTGVEMEALSGVSSALLAIYDLSKIVEPNLKITNTKLLVKSGGKKGLWINPDGIPDKIKKTLNL
jgi:cyclic pyranopterin phosphate synthase